MSLNNTPSGERLHISFFGKRNVGKSSLVNAITNQEVSVVSDVLGTTTDPVKKSMEILPLGPVLIIDTPGFDDEGKLGEKRVEKAREILRKTDIAILVCDASKETDDFDKSMIDLFLERDIPYIIAFNKCDTTEKREEVANSIYVSAKTKENVEELKEMIAKLKPDMSKSKCIVADLLNKGDTVILVTPIDESAPKGRIILPQQETLRELLDYHMNVIVCQLEELESSINMLNKKPSLVITDSQVFEKVNEILDKDIKLTSFSILFARYKGSLKTMVEGVSRIKSLKDNDNILISEACTHHRQCNDIGSVKIPSWLEKYTGKKFNYSFTSGNEFPQKLDEYSLIIHCGGCMINEKEMKYRMKYVIMNNKAMTNYGILIAYIHNILNRSLEIFPDIAKMLS